MRSKVPTLALFSMIAAAGCERGRAGEHEPGCDSRALERLADQLSGAAPEQQVALVRSGLLAACGEHLPLTTRAMLSPVDDGLRGAGVDETEVRLRARVCPNHERVFEQMPAAPPSERRYLLYDGCDLQRYGLVERAELGSLEIMGWYVWTTHEWLISTETPSEVARPISRALLYL
jgi:hypothetical protein